MSDACFRRPAGGATPVDIRDATGARAADWLCLAAAPSFAVMALLTFILADGHSHMLCSAPDYASPVSGMALMYLLMSVFHSSPWLKLISSGKAGHQE
jgi:hypothetical protein